MFSALLFIRVGETIFLLLFLSLYLECYLLSSDKKVTGLFCAVENFKIFISTSKNLIISNVSVTWHSMLIHHIIFSLSIDYC